LFWQFLVSPSFHHGHSILFGGILKILYIRLVICHLFPRLFLFSRVLFYGSILYFPYELMYKYSGRVPFFRGDCPKFLPVSDPWTSMGRIRILYGFNLVFLGLSLDLKSLMCARCARLFWSECLSTNFMVTLLYLQIL
jgi:hypothetical protein